MAGEYSPTLSDLGTRIFKSGSEKSHLYIPGRDRENKSLCGFQGLWEKNPNDLPQFNNTYPSDMCKVCGKIARNFDKDTREIPEDVVSRIVYIRKEVESQ